jgi:hypothetical protein
MFLGAKGDRQVEQGRYLHLILLLVSKVGLCLSMYRRRGTGFRTVYTYTYILYIIYSYIYI